MYFINSHFTDKAGTCKIKMGYAMEGVHCLAWQTLWLFICDVKSCRISKDCATAGQKSLLYRYDAATDAIRREICYHQAGENQRK